MEKHPICITRTIKFSEKLLGIYCYEINSKPLKDRPFYAINKKRINLDNVKKNGLCNVGLFNLLRRFNKLPIHGTGKIDFYPREYECLGSYFKKKKMVKFRKGKKYPPGTLLFSLNKMAMILKNNNIIHCNHKKGMVSKDLLDEFDFLYCCHPKYWILLE